MSADAQEWVALGIVSLAAFAAGFHGYRSYLALPLSEWLLKKGKVKLAMKIHPRFRKPKSSKTQDCCG